MGDQVTTTFFFDLLEVKLFLPGVPTSGTYSVVTRGKRDSADFDFWATRGKREEGATLNEN